jgi:hypothetical protein
MILWQFDVSLTADRFKGPRWLSRGLKSIFLFLTFLGGFVAVGGTSIIYLWLDTSDIADIKLVAVDIGLTNNCLCYISVSNNPTKRSGNYIDQRWTDLYRCHSGFEDTQIPP